MLATTTRLRLVLIAALCCIAVGAVFFVGSDTGTPSAGSGQTELHNLDEEMLIGESVVPPLKGTTWGSMVAIPRGPQPSVSPAACVLFLSQGPAGEKGLAMRSSKNASIGVTLSVDGPRPDLPALREECGVFTYAGPGVNSRVELEPMPVADLPDGAISTLMHCRTVKSDQILVWDIALIVGYHRGVLVTAQYSPGPQGGAFDSQLAASLGDVYRAQVEKLDDEIGAA
jgi:hypothetical protein